MNHHEPSRRTLERADKRAEKRGDDVEPDAQRRALIERARQLGATAEELQAELDALALQAQAVLHRLRGGNLH